ncbi:hypothetical protein [Enterococcus cecorum]|uniref:Phage protein n=1 Tax=Enterococcus cecorum DSM 20682 = ATCC 43198 TaxID=1121864 RepID=S1RM37_9ENTE|nr:hypothetical protein [Enterococcus cecorum]EOX19010.1 hypothetical protein I567_00764 [Enterococcus cecorum DSM 20682 = ATCC 43198]ESK61260.1 hypothetical protein OMO_01320 [Enterococcus cecorum DSM 20682 = ATCC 43198]CAI3432335.1 hypothetical protein CIRMBP1318_01237 [Enterococcus cecorum DSM 20682 = ATCC 43198]SQE56666.1 gp10 family protein [Enterococcus cecorum]
MNDMLMEIYNKLATSTIIDNKRIKFYETPENMNLNSAPFIVISPLAPPEPSYYGSDDELAMEMTYQVNVEATKRMKAKEVQLEVKKLLKQLGFSQLTGGLDAYFKETKRYVDARRYIYVSDIYKTDY